MAAPDVFRRFISSPDAILIVDHDGATAIGEDPLVRPPAPEVVQAMQAVQLISGTTGLIFTGRAPQEINAFYGHSPALVGASAQTRTGADLTFDLGDGDAGTIPVVGRHGLVRGPEFGGKGRIDLTPGQEGQLTRLRDQLPAELTERFGAAGLNVKVENAVGGAGLIEALGATSEPPPDPPNTVTLAFTENGVCVHVNQLEPALAEQVGSTVAHLVADRGWGQPGGNPNEYVVLRANRGQGFSTTRSHCPEPNAPCVFVGDDKGDLAVLTELDPAKGDVGVVVGHKIDAELARLPALLRGHIVQVETPEDAARLLAAITVERADAQGWTPRGVGANQLQGNLRQAATTVPTVTPVGPPAVQRAAPVPVAAASRAPRTARPTRSGHGR